MFFGGGAGRGCFCMFWFVCFLLRSGTKMEWMICPGFCRLCVRLHHQQLASQLCPPPNCQSCLADRSPSPPSLTKVSQLCPLPNCQSCITDLSPSPPLTKVSQVCPPPNCQSCLTISVLIPPLAKVSQLCPPPNWQSCLADLSPSPPSLTKVSQLCPLPNCQTCLADLCQLLFVFLI